MAVFSSSKIDSISLGCVQKKRKLNFTLTFQAGDCIKDVMS